MSTAPDAASAAQASLGSNPTGISPYLGLLIEIVIPLALLIVVAWAGELARSTSLQLYATPLDSAAAVLGAQDSIDVSSALLGRGSPLLKLRERNPRFRLGDTVYGGQFDDASHGTWLIAHGGVFYAFVTDSRLRFKASPPSPAFPPKQAAVESGKSVRGANSAARPPYLRLVGYPAEKINPAEQKPLPPASQMPPPLPSKSPQESVPAMRQAEPLPHSFSASPTEQGVPRASKTVKPTPSANAAEQSTPPPATVATTLEIVTAATMTALLRADAREFSSVVIGVLGLSGGLSAQDSTQAEVSAITRLADRLGSIRRILVLTGSKPNEQSEFRQFLIPRSTLLWRILATPLPLPGGSRLIEPHPVDSTKLPANLDDMVNSIYRVNPQNTRLPALAFMLLGCFGLLAGRRRYAYAMRGISWRGLLDGAALTVGLIVILALLWHFWRWFPESWLASASGLTCIALASGALEGGLLSALHQAPRPLQVEKDPALRTVLYRDVPVDDIARDRLGFAPLIEALRRFLDNPDTAPPVVLSINGPWGSGKSSVMKMLARELEKTGRFRIVWFNAWQYHREQQILSAFLQTIARQLSQQWGPVFALRLGWKRWQDTSLPRQLGLVVPLALVAAGLLHPDLRDKLADYVSKLAAGEYGALIKLALGSASIGTIGGLLWAISILWPFRMRFTRLFEGDDQGHLRVYTSSRANFASIAKPSEAKSSCS